MSKRKKGKPMDPTDPNESPTLPAWEDVAPSEDPAAVAARGRMWLPEHVATVLGVAVTTVRELVAERGLPCVTIGRTRPIRRFDPQKVRAWIDQQHEAEPEA